MIFDSLDRSPFAWAAVCLHLSIAFAGPPRRIAATTRLQASVLQTYWQHFSLLGNPDLSRSKERRV